ncbi:hypothetical protein J2W28_004479 [Variovorax boronicumulans]|uniref:hypothetical protein n=1 Tax=Variovorax boronicumulans TaxID=436515 RepID=UPI002788651A|nr:hypothetical protein [Variovorax boronicumulans]MDP9993818.1 hypothetical protein [Variovorax boronicumulans]MDQ0005317.1 hypothetical protein [Variovorax boronicumulans]
MEKNFSSQLAGFSYSTSEELHAIEGIALARQSKNFDLLRSAKISSAIGTLELLPLARVWKSIGLPAVASVCETVTSAIQSGEPTARADKGVVHFLRAREPGPESDQIDSFLLTFRKSLKSAGVETASAMAISGAFGEMHDNIWEHSGKPQSGLCGYEIYPSRSVAFGVADSGWGLSGAHAEARPSEPQKLASQLMTAAVMNGASRFNEAGRGTGFSTLLRILRKFDASIRVRSDDVSLNLKPNSASAHEATLKSQAQLRGFVVCAQINLCHTKF